MNQRLLAGMISAVLPLGAAVAHGSYVRTGANFRSPTLTAAGATSLPRTPRHATRELGLERAAAEIQIAEGQLARELVVIDQAVPDKHLFYRHSRPGIAVVEIESGRDGLDQLLDAVRNYRGLQALHVVSHAQAGKVRLGNSAVSQADLKRRLDVLSALDGALIDGADVHFYGCDLAQDDSGEELLELIAGAANVDVAASTDRTGSADEDGDWDLELRVGQIETDHPFSERALAAFDDVLAIDDATGKTVNMNGFPSGFAYRKIYDVDSSGFILRLQTNSLNGNSMYCVNTANAFCGANAADNAGYSSLTIDFTAGQTFDIDSLQIYTPNGTAVNYVFTPSSGTPVTALGSGTATGFAARALNFTDITSVTITRQDGGDLSTFWVDDMVISNAAAPPDSDGDLTAAAPVTEPVNLPFSVDTVGEAVDVFDVTLTDGGTGDGLALTVSEVVVHVSGTSTDAERDKITWRLNGADVSNAVGTYSAAGDTITFSGTGVSIADGTSEIYTLNAYYNDNTGITPGNTVILSVDGDTDLTVGGGGTQMGSTSPVSNGSGTTLTDDIAPVVNSVAVPADGTYVAGQNLDFTVNFNEAITVNTAGGTPRISVDIGGATRNASYLSGSGSSALVFRYTVLTGDSDGDGISLTSLSANGGTMRDASGNDATTTLNNVGDLSGVLVDGVAPTVAEVTPVATPTNDTTPDVIISTDEAGTLAVGGSCGSAAEGAVGSGSTTIALTQPDNSTALAPGDYSDCTVTVTDAAGNVSNTVTLTSFTVDTSGPTVAEVTPVATPTNDTTPDVTISTSEAGTLAVGGSCGSAAEGAIGSGSTTIALTQPDNSTPLAPGSYSDCTVTVTDAAGNVSNTVTLTSFTVDTSGPTVAEVTPVATPTNDTTPDVTISTSEAGTLAVGGSCGSAAEGAVGSGSTTIALTQPDNSTALAPGDYSDCTVTATDAAGNVSNTVTLTSFTVDTAGPTVAEVTPVSSPTNDTTPDVTISTSEAGTLAVGGSCGSAAEGAVGSGSTTIALTQPDNSTPLAPGSYSDCTVTVTDGAGNISNTVTLTPFTVDTSGPTVAEVTAVSTPTSDTTPDVTISTDEAGTLAIGGSCGSAAEGAVGAGNWTIELTQPDNSTVLAPGTYSDCTIIVTDASGNASSTLTLTAFTVDTDGPTVSEVTPVSSPTNDTTPDVIISTDEAGTLAVGGSCGSAAEGAVGSGNTTIALTQPDNSTPLAAGTYNDCTVTVTDAASNVSNTVTLTAFTIDTSAPTVAEVTPVATPTSDTTPDVTISTDEAGTLAVGGSCGSAAEGAIGSGSTTIELTQPDNSTVLAQGSYSDCTVIVTDASGNASNTLTLTAFTVDTAAPSVTEVTPVSSPTSDTTPDVTISSDEAGTLAVGGSCGSAAEGAVGTGSTVVTLTQPDNSSPLAPGSYTDCSVTVTDAAGNVSSPLTLTGFTVGTAPPFSKAFSPDAIAVGDMSILTLTVDNVANGTAATSLDVTDNLPAGMTVAATPNASTTCTGGTLSAAAGSGTISYGGGSVAAGTSCTIEVDVTTSAAGSFVNTTGDLTSSLGNSGPASDTLVVNAAPGFAKAFTPNTIGVTGISTLSFSIDNSTSTLDATGLDFTDNLPSGMTVAATPNASTTCTGGTLTAVAESGVVSYTGGTVSAGVSCSIEVDVTAASPGGLVNTTGDLTSSLGNSGQASDTLTVNASPTFSKAFAPAAIATDGVSTLTFTIDNTANGSDADDLDFTDAFPAGMTLATPPNGSATCAGGALTAVAGAGTVGYTGGSVSAGGTCTVQVDVTADVAGALESVSGQLTSSLGASGTATATLTVVPAPSFSKSFAPNPGLVNEPIVLTYTIDNSAGGLSATGLDFTEALPTNLTLATPANASMTCTGGTLTAPDGGSAVTYSGGSVGAGAACLVSVEVQADAVGSFDATSGDLTSSLGNSGPSSATLVITPPLAFSATLNPEPVSVNQPSTLTFRIDNTAGTADASSLTFALTIPAPVSVATPANGSNSCGGSLIAVEGGDSLMLSGGSLIAGAVCEVTVDLVSPSAGDTTLTTGVLTSSLGPSGMASATLSVVDGVDLAIAINNGVDGVGEGEAVVYVITVSNPGTVDVEFATVSVPSPVGLLDVMWTCDSDDPGADCSPSGDDAIVDTVDLPAGADLNYVLGGSVDLRVGETLTVAGEVQPPVGITDVQPGNNAAADTDLVIDLIFRAGFERTGTTNDVIFGSGFEVN